MDSKPPPEVFSSQDIEDAIGRLDREVEQMDSELKQKKADRDNLRDALALIRNTVLARPKIGPVVIRPHRSDREPDEKEKRIMDAIRKIGRFGVSRDIATEANMDPKAMSRITPRMRLRGLLVSHPLADPNGKFHFPLGLPEFLDAQGMVKPEHEYPSVDKLSQQS